VVIALYILFPLLISFQRRRHRVLPGVRTSLFLPLEDLLFHSPKTDFGRLTNRKFTSCFWPIRVLSKCYPFHNSIHSPTHTYSPNGDVPLSYTHAMPNAVIVALYTFFPLLLTTVNWILGGNHFSMSLTYYMSSSYVNSVLFNICLVCNIENISWLAQ